jgi:predicted permease
MLSFQQIVDAGKQGDGSGGLAFVLLVILIMAIWASLFFMDRIRRRSEERSAE